MRNPTASLYNLEKTVLRYLEGTSHTGLKYNTWRKVSCLAPMTLIGHMIRQNESILVDSYTTLVGGKVSWSCEKRNILDPNTMKSDYNALGKAIRETLSLKTFEEIPFFPHWMFIITVWEDNQACIPTSVDKSVTVRSKHIDARYHMIVDNIHKGMLKVPYVTTHEMLADVMKKAPPRAPFQYLSWKLGI